MAEFLFGCDIGGTAVKIGLFDIEGNLIEKKEIPTRKANKGANIIPDLIAAAGEMLAERDKGWGDTVGFGLDVPGPVKDHSYVIRCVNLGWRDMNVRDMIRELTGLELVMVENDAKSAALGEWWRGGHGDCSSAVLITLGTAVGGGVILDGKIHSGTFGAAGELSHIQVNPDETEPCACGKYGHLQQYVSNVGIVEDYKKRAGLGPDAPEIDAREVFDLARDGDPAALGTVNKIARDVARVMAMVSAVLDPALYLIGGGISKAGDILMDPIRREFKNLALFASEDAIIETAKLGNDAGMYGAAKLVLDQLPASDL